MGAASPGPSGPAVADVHDEGTTATAATATVVTVALRPLRRERVRVMAWSDLSGRRSADGTAGSQKETPQRAVSLRPAPKKFRRP